MENKTQIMGVCLDVLEKRELIEKTTEYLYDDRLDIVWFADTSIVIEAAEQKNYAARLLEGALVLPAESALFSRRELGLRRDHRIMIGQNALDTMLTCGDREKVCLYLVGDNEKEMLTFMECVKVHYPEINVIGAYFVEPGLSEDLKLSDESIVNEINGHDIDMLVVMMESPVQEEWIIANRTLLHAKLCIAMGSVKVPYLYFFRIRHGAAKWPFMKKIHYFVMSGLSITKNHKRRTFQKKVEQYGKSESKV